MRQYRFVSQDTINQVMTEFATQCKDNKLIGYEQTVALLKIVQDFSPKGIGILKRGNSVCLQFIYPTKTSRSKPPINEMFNEVGLYNALDKAYGVFEALKQFDKLSDFENWFTTEIQEQKEIIDDIVTVGKAIELVKTNYFNSTDKCGRLRSEFPTSSQANYQSTYNTFFKHLESLSDKPLTAKLLIEVIESTYSHLGQSTGFKHCVTAYQKLLIETRLHGSTELGM
jgi:hypothetical protein